MLSCFRRSSGAAASPPALQSHVGAPLLLLVALAAALGAQRLQGRDFQHFPRREKPPRGPTLCPSCPKQGVGSTEGETETKSSFFPPPQPRLGGLWGLPGAHQLLFLLPEAAEQPRVEQPVAGGHGVVGELGDSRTGGPRWGSLPNSAAPSTELQPSLGRSPGALGGDGTPEPGTFSPSTSSER